MNYIMQLIWIGIFAVTGLLSLAGAEFTFWLLIFAFFLGLNHLMVSLVDLAVYGRKSQFKYHLIGSVIYLILLFGGGAMESFLGMHATGILRDMSEVLVIGIPIVLAIYFWYLSLKDGYPYKRKSTDVFEL